MNRPSQKQSRQLTGIPVGKRLSFRLPTDLRSSNLGKVLPELLALYRSVERDIARFKKATGLECLSGCGACCENPRIEVTVAEFLPLAVYLYRSGQADLVLERCKEVKGKGVCVFYLPARSKISPGGCRIYQLRPLLCRLFGFSAVCDKQGTPVLVTCSSIKEKFPGAIKKARQYIETTGRVPTMNFYARRLWAIEPSLSQEFVPLNSAIEQALCRVGMVMKYLRDQNFSQSCS
jgi:uncharacterized protein